MKTKNATVAKPTAQETSAVRIVKRDTAPSLSGRSKLVYEVGVGENPKDVLLRVVANSGGGTWNGDWHRLGDLLAAIDRAAKGEPVRAELLMPRFRGSSMNSVYFFLAVLLHAGFVVPSENKKRCYGRADGQVFLDEVKGLIDGKAAEAGKPKKAKASPESHTESPSASTKKKKAKS